nr:uncharacterized mitochondrial protein AtMg00810-like [Tanacetum cinerariifolium]
MCKEFEKMMHKKFQMSYMGELTFFLGLKVTQKDDGIFISQDRYVDEILKKFGFSTVKRASTPMETSKPLIKDENAEGVDVHLYRSMIGSLMYLTFLRPDIMFAVCACAKFQVTPKVSHLHAMKRIYGYLKGQPNLGLWYPKDSPFNLEAYTDSDYAGASLDRKSTIGDETVHKERRDIVERAATTAASLDAELDSGIINKTQSTAIPNESIPQGTGLGGSLRVNTLGSGEDSMQLIKLMEVCTKLFAKVLALKNNKTAQDLEITHLKKKVKSLEKKRKSRTPQLKRSTPITTAGVSISTVEPSTHPTTTTTVIEDKDLIIAQTLMKMRSEKSKEKSKERGSKEKSSETATIPTRGVILREASKTTTRPTVPPQQELDPKDKEVQKALDNTMSWINSFVPMDKEEVEGIGKKAKRSRKEAVSKKRAKKGFDEESVKRQKLKDDAEKEEL